MCVGNNWCDIILGAIARELLWLIPKKIVRSQHTQCNRAGQLFAPASFVIKRMSTRRMETFRRV